MDSNHFQVRKYSNSIKKKKLHTKATYVKGMFLEAKCRPCIDFVLCGNLGTSTDPLL